MLKVNKLDSTTYKQLLAASKVRYFFNQMGEFGESKMAEGNKVDYLSFSDSSGETQALALVVYYQYKKILHYGNCIFGPTLLNPSPKLLDEVLQTLKKTVLRHADVCFLRCNPLIPANLYEDVTMIAENVGDDYRSIFRRNGFAHINREWYQDPNINLRCIYNKPIAGMSYPEILASLTPNLKMRMRKAEQSGIKVRMLNLDELDIFDHILEETYARMDTNIAVRPAFHRSLWRHFGSKIYFPVAYINCDEALNTYKTLVESINLAQAELDAQYGENRGKKYQNLSRDNTDQLNRLHNLTAKVAALRKERGEIVYLCAGCFIESGQDFIHLLGGGEKALMNFDGVLAMHAHMLQLAVQGGFANYNLYGCSDLLDEATNNVDYGVLQFKRTFRGNFEEFIGTYEFHKSWLAL